MRLYVEIYSKVSRLGKKSCGRNADNKLWSLAPPVINIVSMHRSIITIRFNTRVGRAPGQTPLWGIIPDYYPERVARHPGTAPEGALPSHPYSSSSTPLRARPHDAFLPADPLWSSILTLSWRNCPSLRFTLRVKSSLATRVYPRLSSRRRL